MEKKETKNNQQFFANIVDTYDMIEVTSGRGCSECPNYILGRDLGYCKNHSTSGNSYLLPKESRMKITYSPVYESIWTDGNTIPACHFCPCHPPNTEASWERELERLVYECGFFGDCRERGEKGKRDLKTFILSEKNKAREEMLKDVEAEMLDKIDRNELMMDFRNDLYAPLFRNMKKAKMISKEFSRSCFACSRDACDQYFDWFFSKKIKHHCSSFLNKNM